MTNKEKQQEDLDSAWFDLQNALSGLRVITDLKYARPLLRLAVLNLKNHRFTDEELREALRVEIIDTDIIIGELLAEGSN